MPHTPHYHIVVLPGDGIGVEVTREVVKVLNATTDSFDFSIQITKGAIGGTAIDRFGTPLPDETLEACLKADAVFLGAVGGPKWDDLTGSMRPESGLLKLRKALDVYANLRPVSVPESLTASSPLKPERVAGVDLLVVRELTGGIYFGTPKDRRIEDGQEVAFNTMHYRANEIERVARIAFEWAARRNGRVTSVDKANVLVVSQLWRSVVTELHRQAYPEIKLDHLYVDNAAMQLVRDPRQFDVLLTGNLFGDILSDLAATLPGSLGMLPSASIGGKVGLFEPVHGSAPDIAGQEKANPIAAILSAAMLLEEIDQADAARCVRDAVQSTLDDGLRSPDLWSDGYTLAGTAELGSRIAQYVAARQSIPT